MRTMKTLAAVVVSLAALAAPTALMAPAAQAGVVAKTVVYGFGPGCPGEHLHHAWAHPEVRPRQAHFGLACESGIHRIRWRDWRPKASFGHGSFLLFNGFGFSNRPATIALSRVRLHHGQRYFSRLVIVWRAKNGNYHKLVLNWRYLKAGRLWGWF